MRKTQKLTGAQRSFLENLFPGEDSLFSPEETLVFGTDNSRKFAPPLAVVRPGDSGQVAKLLRWAHAENMPIYPRARATNAVGGCVPEKPGIAVSTLKMNRIEEIDADDFVAVVEPGVITQNLKKKAAEKGLMYPPDPASMKFSTVGGNIAMCAGGMSALKYGVTREYVLGLEAVLPGGGIIRTGGRTHKDVTGLDLTRLLVGSEGTLAFITKAIVKLLPKPESTASLLACYASMDEAVIGIRAIFRAGMLPTALEFLEETAMRCIAKSRQVPWPEESGAALLIRLDGSHDALGPELARLRKVVDSTGPTCVLQGLGPEEEEPLWELRRMISPSSFHLGPDKYSNDVAVPRGRLLEAVRGIKAISRRRGVPIVCYGHFGDGNIHTNIMHDAADASMHDSVSAARNDLIDLVLSLGGVLSGEHGIGLTKIGLIGRQIGRTELTLMHALKKQFDPQGIMNPGKAY